MSVVIVSITGKETPLTVDVVSVLVVVLWLIVKVSVADTAVVILVPPVKSAVSPLAIP